MTFPPIKIFSIACFTTLIVGCSNNSLDVPSQIAKQRDADHISQTNRPTTSIRFSLPEESVVSLTIYDAIGTAVAKLIDHADLDQGEQEVDFNASSLSSGLYFYLLEARGVQSHRLYNDERKILLIK